LSIQDATPILDRDPVSYVVDWINGMHPILELFC